MDIIRFCIYEFRKSKILSLYDENNYSLIEKLSENGKQALLELCELNKELIELVTIPGIGNTKSLKIWELLEERDNNNPNYVDFYNKKHPLFITPYIEEGVLLKYPVNDETTVEEVNEYFVDFVNTLSFNKKENAIKIINN